MTREHKYRAWIPTASTMIEVSTIRFGGELPVVTDAETGAQFFLAPEFLHEFIGLQDKNGQDIYEGDRLSKGPNFEDFVIEYDFCSFVKRWCGDRFTLPIKARDVKEFEVVGNIYENPELLSEHKEKGKIT